jgi:hypothetical protein
LCDKKFFRRDEAMTELPRQQKGKFNPFFSVFEFFALLHYLYLKLISTKYHNYNFIFLMKKNILFWTLAVIITVGSAAYQRMTGPTHPLKGKVILANREIKYTLDRSCDTSTNYKLQIKTGDPSIVGFIIWKRYKTNDEWNKVQMNYIDDKLQYSVMLKTNESTVRLPENDHVVVRFKGDVPTSVLIVHVIVMFVGMLFSNRAGIESFAKEPNFKKFIFWTLGLLAMGGLLLGPIVQKYAFGVYWSGWPFGIDLTDNKTMFAFISWVLAVFSIYKFKNPKRWILAAAIITLAVYLIPHSLLGSELDYSKLPQQ